MPGHYTKSLKKKLSKKPDSFKPKMIMVSKSYKAEPDIKKMQFKKKKKEKLLKENMPDKKPVSTQARGDSHRISETSRGKRDLKKAHQSKKKKYIFKKIRIILIIVYL